VHAWMAVARLCRRYRPFAPFAPPRGGIVSSSSIVRHRFTGAFPPRWRHASLLWLSEYEIGARAVRISTRIVLLFSDGIPKIGSA